MRTALLLASLLTTAVACGGSYTPGDGGVIDSRVPIPVIPDASEPTGTPDAGVDTAVRGQPTEGLYFTACLSKLAAGRVDRVLRFYTQTTLTPDATGATGKLTLTLTPMKLGPGNTAPPTVSKDQTLPPSFTVTNTPTSETGSYVANLGTVTVPGASNPISGRDIVIEMASVPGKFAKGKFCSQLIGHVTAPTDIPLVGDDNTCIYIPVREGDPTPVLNSDLSDFPAVCAL